MQNGLRAGLLCEQLPSSYASIWGALLWMQTAKNEWSLRVPNGDDAINDLLH
jgi:hypothetical protein